MTDQPKTKKYESRGVTMETLGVSASTLKRWRKARVIDALPPVSPGGHWRYDVQGFIENGRARLAAKTETVAAE